MTYISVACRCLLAAVFLAALLSKLRAREQFVEAVQALTGMAESRAQPTAAAAFCAEGTVVALQLAPVVPVGVAAAATVGVLASFTAVLARALRKKARVACGCFGNSSYAVSLRHVWRNVALAGFAALAVLAHALSGAGSPAAAGVAVAIGYALIVAVPIIFLDEIAVLFQRTGAPEITAAKWE